MIFTKKNVQKNDLEFKNKDYNKIQKNRLKKYKKVWFTFGILFIFLILFFCKKNNYLELNLFESDDVDIKVYYSKGSKDNEKKEQYIFSFNDPIQIEIVFKNMSDGGILDVSLLNLDNKEIKQYTNVPVNKIGGSRFVSVDESIRKETGKYKVEVFIKDKEENKFLKKIEFEIR